MSDSICLQNTDILLHHFIINSFSVFLYNLTLKISYYKNENGGDVYLFVLVSKVEFKLSNPV